MIATMPRAISLKVPADPSMMLIIRLTTAGVLARSGMTIDAVDDIKLAAEEACNCLIRSSGCSWLKVTYRLSENSFHLLAETDDCDVSYLNVDTIKDDEIAVIRCVLLSLTDQVELGFGGGCLRSIELCKQLPA